MRNSLSRRREASLIRRAIKGDREAFGELYLHNVYAVFQHIYGLVPNATIAEDLTAQTFLNALEAMHRFQYRGTRFLSWLLRIAHNLTLQHLKNQKRDGHIPLLEGVEAGSDNYNTPEALYEARSQRDFIWSQVSHLSWTQRRVLIMRFVDGLKPAEIAEVLGKSEGAVRIMQWRALSTLRQKVEAGLDR